MIVAMNGCVGHACLPLTLTIPALGKGFPPPLTGLL
jgi:hypothetical protein